MGTSTTCKIIAATSLVPKKSADLNVKPSSPTKSEISKSSMPLSEILRYQEIDENELKEAVRQYNA